MLILFPYVQFRTSLLHIEPSCIRAGATTGLLTDARGSIVQEASGASVTSWHRYSAFGQVTDGTDVQEKAFFGYNGEAQSPVTGLVYMRFRHYDPASAHFGVADTYLGDAFAPLSLNRYLFCESDPVNHIDPSGHAASSLFGFASKSKRGSAALQAYNTRKQAQVNSIAARAVAAIRNTIPSPAGRISTPSSSQYKVNSVYRPGSSKRYGSPRINPKSHADRALEEFRAYYCGDFAKLMQSSLNSMSPSERMHAALDTLGMMIPLPVASSIPDLLNGLMYGVEGDGQNAGLSLTFAGIAFIGGSAGKDAAKGIHIGSGIAKDSVKVTGKAILKRAGKIEQNRLNHIFGDPKHKLDGLVAKYGSEEAAFHVIEEGVLEYANRNGLETTTKWTRVVIAGEEVDATWRTVDGVLSLVDASRRDIA